MSRDATRCARVVGVLSRDARVAVAHARETRAVDDE